MAGDFPSGKAPTVGRVVHYNTDAGPCAALVIGVHRDPWDMVDLVVFHRPKLAGPCIELARVSAHGCVRIGTAPGSWSWPVLV